MRGCVSAVNVNAKMHTDTNTVYTAGTVAEKHLSGPLLQLPAGTPTTQLGVFAGEKPAGDDVMVFTVVFFFFF